MGEGSDVSEGTGEGTKGYNAANEEGTEEKDGESVSVRKQRKMNNGRERPLALLRGDNSYVLRESVELNTVHVCRACCPATLSPLVEIHKISVML